MIVEVHFVFTKVSWQTLWLRCWILLVQTHTQSDNVVKNTPYLLSKNTTNNWGLKTKSRRIATKARRTFKLRIRYLFNAKTKKRSRTNTEVTKLWTKKSVDLVNMSIEKKIAVFWLFRHFLASEIFLLHLALIWALFFRAKKKTEVQVTGGASERLPT